MCDASSPGAQVQIPGAATQISENSFWISEGCRWSPMEMPFEKPNNIALRASCASLLQKFDQVQLRDSVLKLVPEYSFVFR